MTFVLANVKNKSSWIDLYIWVWGSRKKFRDHFSDVLRYHFSSSEPTPKEEQQRQYFCCAEQSKTPLGRYRRPFVKISSHENMGSGQKVVKSPKISDFYHFVQNRVFWGILAFDICNSLSPRDRSAPFRLKHILVSPVTVTKGNFFTLPSRTLGIFFIWCDLFLKKCPKVDKTYEKNPQSP